jgi:SOS response regulatory protein OraA/RecX
MLEWPMPRGPRQFDSEDELYAAAVGALARRAHSCYEMRKYLERRASDRGRAFAPNVIARLKAEGLIDDARYAALFARAHAANRRQGPLRIRVALELVASPEDEGAALRRRIEIWLRRHGAASPKALDARHFASLYRSLLQAGFAGRSIRSELDRLRGERHGSPEIDVEDG